MGVKVIEGAEDTPSTTYRMDFENRRVYGKVDGAEAVAQAARITLLTPRFKCSCLPSFAGCEVKDAMIVGDGDTEYLTAAIPKLVTAALVKDDRILAVDEVQITQKEDGLYVQVTIDSKYGVLEVGVTL